MKKFGVVKEGVSPSVISGKKSNLVKGTEPLCEGETLKKASSDTTKLIHGISLKHKSGDSLNKKLH